jgi:hypothetical protein
VRCYQARIYGYRLAECCRTGARAVVLAAGGLPDPNYGDWQFQVSDAFFTADFWYRGRFVIPASRAGQHVFLQFDAVNWKADVFFNGQYFRNAIPGREKSIEGASCAVLFLT